MEWHFSNMCTTKGRPIIVSFTPQVNWEVSTYLRNMKQLFIHTRDDDIIKVQHLYNENANYYIAAM